MVRSATEFIIGPRFARTRWHTSNQEAPISSHKHPSRRRARSAAPQDEDFLRGVWFLCFFLAVAFAVTAFLLAGLFLAVFAAFRAFGRFLAAARCAAPSAVLAHWPNSSVSSNSRAGNCQ